MRALKTVQLTLIFVGNGTPFYKTLWAPRRHYTSSFGRKFKFTKVSRRSQGCQMVSNLANIAKNHCFPKNLLIFLAILFNAKNLPFLEIPVVTIHINKIYQINTKTLESTAQILR